MCAEGKAQNAKCKVPNVFNHPSRVPRLCEMFFRNSISQGHKEHSDKTYFVFSVPS
jgi:hypothetical protein